jgi:DNA-directed RNA polymerase subunit L
MSQTSEGINFDFTSTEDPFDINFILSGSKAHSSLANSIRRTVLSDVSTISFKTEPYEENEINIIQNTSSLHNEYLLHRLGMIPLNITDIEKFNPSRYVFSLNETNNSKQIMNITTNHIKVFDTESNSGLGDFISSEEFFPINTETNEYILITKLKPNPNGVGESLHFEGKACKGNGSINARWQPTSCVVYHNTLDSDEVSRQLQLFLDKKKIELGEKYETLVPKLENEFNISHSERYFLKDENGYANSFTFTVESCGILTSHKILEEALKLLVFKIGKFSTELNQSQTNPSESEIIIEQSDAIMDSFDVIIPKENHTLGYLIQSYVQLLKADEIDFVGYCNPHPLKNTITIRLSPIDKKIETLVGIITDVCSQLINYFGSLREQLETQFGVKKRRFVMKPKKKLVIVPTEEGPGDQ